MIRHILPILFLPLLFSCVTQEMNTKCELIAHAGGEIDGYVYTNSLEALQQASERGYKYIEVDFQMTSDSMLVAAYSWEMFNCMTGNENRGDSAMDLRQFMAQRIYGRYTPLTASMVNDYFMKDSTLYLVTDKISDPAILSEFFPYLKKRMVVEAFSYDDYEQLIDEGYYRVLYSCMAEDFSSAIAKNLMFDRLFPGKRIEWVALHTSGFGYRLFKLLDKTRRFNIALFTVDNYNEIEPWQQQRVKMIYTNTLLPDTED